MPFEKTVVVVENKSVVAAEDAMDKVDEGAEMDKTDGRVEMDKADLEEAMGMVGMDEVVVDKVVAAVETLEEDKSD